MPRASCVCVLVGCFCAIGLGCQHAASQTASSGGTPGSGGSGGFQVMSTGRSGGAGTGGKPGTGGAAGGGSANGTGGATGDPLGVGGSTSGQDCVLQSAKLSSGMATVGIVTWS